MLSPLPTLDEIPKPLAKPKPKHMYLIWFLCLIFGMILGVILALFGPDITFEFTPLQILLWLPSLVLAWFVAIIMHEFGHVVGGWLSGMRFWMCMIGPLRIQQKENCIAVDFKRNVTLLSGFVVMIPVSSDHIQRRMVLLIGGGSLFSLVGAILIFGVSYLIDILIGSTTDSLAFSVFQGFLVSLAALSLIAGVITLIPRQTFGFATDGRRLLNLLRGGVKGQQEAATLAIMSLSTAGTRPRDWDRQLLTILFDDAEHTPNILTYFLAYAHAVDTNDIPKAHTYLSSLICSWYRLPPAIQSSIAAESAFFEARFRRDADAAEVWLHTIVDSPFLEQSTRLRAEAAVAWARGQREEVQAKADQAIQALAHTYDRGSAIAEKERLREMLSS
ncbi:MAG: M50 family metallopeptidase [Chloroflexota bacterium]